MRDIDFRPENRFLNKGRIICPQGFTECNEKLIDRSERTSSFHNKINLTEKHSRGRILYNAVHFRFSDLSMHHKQFRSSCPLIFNFKSIQLRFSANLDLDRVYRGAYRDRVAFFGEITLLKRYRVGLVTSTLRTTAFPQELAGRATKFTNRLLLPSVAEYHGYLQPIFNISKMKQSSNVTVSWVWQKNMMYNKSGLAGDCRNNLQQRKRNYSELLAARSAIVT
ncbi:hypothetical protein ALC60_01045 [Trachymyrmex zeteki]|uniref:Uncharacterized protein n=1 Tax=Mycetomoellerius zeteki TaxID=64791 RepID=A0A151XI35_9HYME|nr:hypothetical protein ALC60_01045 [Trachymyrmex zeteki]